MKIINKENYELLMFDLLEGNIKEPERSNLLEQINKDIFLKKEWELFNQTIISPEIELFFPDKSILIKPESKTKIYNFYIISSIAASLLILAIFFAKFYKTETNTITQKNKIESIESKTQKQDTVILPEKLVNTESKKEKNKSPNTNNTLIDEKILNDSISHNLPKNFEDIAIKRKNAEKISYNILPNESTSETELLKIEKYPFKKKKKSDIIIAYTGKIREVWNDLPNVKLNVKPKIKNYRPAIDITLKGEIIYANALIEIK